MDDREAEETYTAIVALLEGSEAGALATEIRRVVAEGMVREVEDTEGEGRRRKKTKIRVTRSLTSREKLATALRLLVSGVEPTIWQVDTIERVASSATDTFDRTKPITWVDEREGDAPESMSVGEPLSRPNVAELRKVLSELIGAANAIAPLDAGDALDSDDDESAEPPR